MSFAETLAALRSGQTPPFPGTANSRDYARGLDAQDPLRHLRGEYIIPSKAMIKTRTYDAQQLRRDRDDSDSDSQSGSGSDPAVYFCGNSLGLQPRATRRFVDAQLDTWAAVGVQGHFVALAGSPLAASWQDLAAACAAQMAPLVGAASPAEVVAMGTLTANLHLLLASFYRPTPTRHKIIAEWKPFPSDSYALASQLAWHGRTSADSLVELQPDGTYISTESILKVIDEHADSAALLLLPGIQYYSGQLFDVAAITAHARRRGLVVGWDLAHAFGNVELRLHDWDVDFAVWCTYKYANSGPGGMAGAFVHERHGKVALDAATGRYAFHPRLSGWYGCDVAVRFDMAKTFQPTPGAQGFQVSNPSAIDLASLAAGLSVFAQTSIADLRAKSLVLTAYAEHLLNGIVADRAAQNSDSDEEAPFTIITPANPMERGAQLSVRLKAGTMPAVAAALDAAGIILDQRKPDVIRIAPVPMYNTFEEVYTVVSVLKKAVL